MSLAAPRSGRRGLGCGRSPGLVLADAGRLPRAESPPPRALPFMSAVSQIATLGRASGQRCRVRSLGAGLRSLTCPGPRAKQTDPRLLDNHNTSMVYLPYLLFAKPEHN